jgi:tripartite-type tricarboxylate transporter receptor subunit TctC
MAATTRRVVLGLGAAALAAPALSQSLCPSGPIRFIVTYPAGGSTDLLSRIWCNRMAEITG